MSQRLILRLGDDRDQLRWVLLSTDRQAGGFTESESGPMDQVPAVNRPIIALASTTDVSLLNARIPPLSRQRAVRAVPFSLEDQLVQDVDDLHFCLGQRNSDGELAVAVVADDQMQSWLDAFAEAGLEVEQIYPEVLALPYTAGAWTVLIENDTFLLRTGLQEGFGGDLDNLSVLLGSALHDAEDDQPLKLIVYMVGEAPEIDVPSSLPVEEHEIVDATLFLAQNLHERDAIGLRIGPYGRRRGWSVQWRRWRVAAVLLAVWVLADTGSAMFQRWQLSRELAEVESAMVQTYRRAFPDGGQLSMYNPRQQMETRLAALRRGGGDSGFLRLLEAAGPLLAADADLQIISMTYRNNGLDLEVSARNLQGIDQLKQRLGAAPGLGVEVVSARAEGERAQGKLRLETSS